MRPEFDHVIAGLAERQYGVFSHGQATGAGASPKAIAHRLDRGLWIPIVDAVYRLPGAPRTKLQTLIAGVLANGDGAVLSHRASMAIWDVPGFDIDRCPLECSRPRGIHHQGRFGLVHESTRLQPSSVTTRRGLPVTTLARTLIDIGTVVHYKRQERALDTCLAARSVSIPAILRELDHMGRWGTGGMRRLLADRGEGYVPTESELEARFIDAVTAAGLPLPRKQVVLGDELPVGRVDFFYPEAKLVVELDGRPWHVALLDAERDKVRDARLVADGLRPMRITWRRLTREQRDAMATLRKALHVQLPQSMPP